MSILQMTGRLEDTSQRFEQRFTGCIDSIEDHIATARQRRFTRYLLRAAALFVTVLLLLAAVVLSTGGEGTLSSLCAVGGAGFGTLGLLLLFIFPSE